MTTARFSALVAVLVVLVATGGIATGAQSSGATAAGPVDCTYPIEVTDATNTTVTIEQEPQRVVALAPSAAQVMWEIGAKEKVVGMPVNYATAYLNGSQNRTNIVNAKFQVVTEEVVNLEPDLVLAPNTIENKTVKNLRQKGLTVVRFELAESVDDVAAKTRLTGRLVGHYEQAAQVSARTTATVEAVRDATSGSENPTVLYAMGGGYTAGSQTFIGDVISAAGGDNIAEAAGIKRYGKISEEVIVTENPEWIVKPSGVPIKRTPAINSTTAVKKGQILTVNANYMSQPGPRVTRPLTTLAGAFHPEAAGNLSVDPSSVSVPRCAGKVSPETTTPSENVTVQITTDENATGTTAGDSGSGSGPGFGVVAALLALVASGLLARRTD